MRIVLVHGNPETAAIWNPLVERLRALGHDDPPRLSPPGFGAPVPGGFAATQDGYRDWLIGELEEIGEPVDLVGHDLGGSHALSVAMERPDLLRSWAVDVIGLLHPDYVWHELGRVWQTPGEGERAIAGQLALTAQQRAPRFTSRGMSDPPATEVAAGFDAAMGECILTYYRNAAQPALVERGKRLGAAAERPGLAIIAGADTLVGTTEQRREMASIAGAQVAELDGLGHWWMTQDGGQAGARALHDFWAQLG
jgi:pimeloyl-ACP methyl ester carboxylesterase